MSLAAHYLVHEKKGVKAMDPVAHFHLSNGACLERINWLADTSSKGIRASAGVMVNYLYKRPHIDDYHEAYTADGKINISKQVKECLKRD